MSKMELDIASSQSASLSELANGYYNLDAELLVMGLANEEIIIESQLVVLSDEVMVAASQSIFTILNAKDSRINHSLFFYSGGIITPTNYFLLYRLFSSHDEVSFKPTLPPELARLSGAFSIYEPVKKILSREKSLSGPIKLESIVIRNVAGEGDSVSINVSSKKHTHSGFMFTCVSNNEEVISEFQLLEKPQKTSSNVMLHLHNDILVKLKGFSGTGWQKSSLFSSPSLSKKIEASTESTFQIQSTNNEAEGMYQKYLDAGSNEKILDGLYAIEDKLMETGMLTTLTGDNEADVSIRYEVITPPDDTEDGPYLVVRITAEGEASAISEQSLEQTRDYISDKLVELLNTVDESISNELYSQWGEIILVNDQRVY
jgi:hypothetical protein